MKKNKVITYYRKSTCSKGKTEEESVAYQQARIHEYAKENELTIVKEFFEVGVTGTIESRPELIEMYMSGTSHLNNSDNRVQKNS